MRLLWLLALGAGCASADYRAAAESADDWAGEDEAPDDADGDGGWGEDAPEHEKDLLLMPAQTDVYVFIANPSRNTVTRINAFSLEVKTAQVGHDPQEVLTTPDHETAVVFNRGDNTVTLLDADTLMAASVEVRPNFNTMIMSPDGEWVALFHDVQAAEPDDPSPGGLQSFNEVSFVHVPSGTHHPMAVGFNPRGIEFTQDSTLAVVVSDESLALVDVTLDTLLPTIIPVAEDPLDPPTAEQVVLSGAGDFAFVRQFGADELVVVDLLDHLVDRVPVGENPTDLQITPDGDRAVVVSRETQELWSFDATDPLEVPEVLELPEGHGFGSLRFDPTGSTGILYTTAGPVDRYATWDLDSDEVVVRSLVKPVAGTAITPTGETLLIFHTEADAPDADPQSPFYGSWALTLVALDDFRTNPLLLPARPTAYANAHNGRLGYFIMEDQNFLEVLDYETLIYEEIPLKSPPVHLGVMPDLGLADEPPAWVSQEHDLGRLSLYRPDEDTLQTITGFELNAQIED